MSGWGDFALSSSTLFKCVSWHDLRGGAALANACSDRDGVRRNFDGNSTPDRFRTVPQLWGLPLGVQHSEYNGNFLG